MSSESLDRLPARYVPEDAGAVDGPGHAIFASVVKLGAGKLGGVTLEGVDGLPGAQVPDLLFVSLRLGTLAVWSKEAVRILSPSTL